METNSGGIVGGMFGLLDKVLDGYKDIKTFDLKQDLLEAQLNQQILFNQTSQDSNINAETLSPITVTGVQPATGVNQNILIFGGLALAGLLILQKA